MQPNAPYQQNMPSTPNEYSFITNPETPAPRRSLPGSGSPIARALIVLVGIFILIMLFMGIRSLLSSGSAGPLYLGLAQDQKAMIHLTEKAVSEPSLSGPNKNFAITAELSFRSSQTKTIDYLVSNGTKLDAKLIGLKISLPLDKQLEDSAAASSYNTLFPQVMKTKLTNYDQALQGAYAKTKGAKGRDLLKSEHNSTLLLLKQLEDANP